jgi:hypothetical protein
VAGAADIELANSGLPETSGPEFFSVEGKGFENASEKRLSAAEFDGGSREMVPRIWRKMHSPGLSRDRVKALEEFSIEKSGKTRDFLGSSKPDASFCR